MLRGSPLTAATVSIVRSGANPQADLRALEGSFRSELAHVVGRRDDNDPVALTLDIYVQDQQNQETLRLESTRPPAFSRKCSWATLKQLQANLQVAVAGHNNDSDSSRCDVCTQLTVFLEHCFESPAVFDRSWNGAMVLNTSRVAHFVNTILRFVHAITAPLESDPRATRTSSRCCPHSSSRVRRSPNRESRRRSYIHLSLQANN